MVEEQKSESPSTPEDKGTGDAAKLQGALGSAMAGTKTAAGAARRGWGFIKFFLPKKWTFKKAVIAGVIVMILIAFVVFTIQWIIGWLKFVLIGALILAGLFFMFGPRPK